MTVPYPSLRVLLSYVSPEADLQCPIPLHALIFIFQCMGKHGVCISERKSPVGYLRKVRICHFNGLLKQARKTGANKPGTKDRTRCPGSSNLQAKRASAS